MKAEHRKELHTNLLRSQLGKLVGTTKNSSRTFWFILLGLVMLGVLYWWWTTSAANRITVAWMDYWFSRNEFLGPTALERVQIDHKGTAAARAARLTLADELYEQAFRSISAKTREKAVSDPFVQAQKLYEEVQQQAGNSTDLALRATLGIAKCEESRGELQKAVSHYQEVVDKFDKPTRAADGMQHPLVAEAARRKERLAAQSAGALFYKGWPERLPRVEPTPAPKSDSQTGASEPPTLQKPDSSTAPKSEPGKTDTSPSPKSGPAKTEPANSDKATAPKSESPKTDKPKTEPATPPKTEPPKNEKPPPGK